MTVVKERQGALNTKLVSIVSWTMCALPSLALVLYEETPGLSGLDGINAAGLVVLSPIFIAIGFICTAAQIALSRWIFNKISVRFRFSFALLSLAIVGTAALPLVWGDWLLLGVVEFAAVPAALLLAPGPPRAPTEDADISLKARRQSPPWVACRRPVAANNSPLATDWALTLRADHPNGGSGWKDVVQGKL